MNNGAPLKVIQSLLGHEKSETTRICTVKWGLRQELYYNTYTLLNYKRNKPVSPGLFLFLLM
ncbi:hypothetical protein [Bacillus sp. OTU2372]|uniref:hypothetical protein n=1 Tax=Bacillus sp. OTU2372 TaxID=3043858 RepID=UPI00406C2E8D